MPASVSWLRYISLCTTALISMMAGAQCVHVLYRPLDDLDELVERSLKEQLEQRDNNGESDKK